MTAKQALIRGHLFVTVPVMAAFLLAFLASSLGSWRFVAAFVVAWAYWSFAAPRWRLRALASVTDTASAPLLAAAVRTGLLWREGSWFERTEFRPRDYAGLEARGRLLCEARQFARTLDDTLADDWGANAIEEIQAYVRPLLEFLSTEPRDPMKESAAVGALAAQLLIGQRADLLRLSRPFELRASAILAASDQYRAAFPPADVAHVTV